MAIDKQKAKISNLYGIDSDEVCYAHERLVKLGVKPFLGKRFGGSNDKFAEAMRQAKTEDRQIAVYLSSGVISGLFVVSPDKLADNPEYCEYVFEEYKKNQQKLRWDKPIEQQKKEEVFDHFRNYEYKKEISNLYGIDSDEVCYAHERLVKLGVKPFLGRRFGSSDDKFAKAMRQAKAENRRVAVYLSSGVISGLFVVSPDKSADDPEYCKSKFEEYRKNQQKLRWDKPIEQQKTEERAFSQKVGGKV